MSMENVKKFMELVKAEESLAKRMVALKDGLQEGEFAFKDDKEFVEKKILPLAKEYGIEFSVEDFMEFTSSQLTSLSEDELAEISGGFPGIGLLIGLSVFLGGAATPTIASKAVSYFTGGGTSTSTVQSVTTEGTDETANEDTEEKGNKIAFDESFKKIKKEFSKNIKEAFDNVKSYMSPQKRSTWIESVANQSKQISPSEDKYVNSRYNKANDRIEFTATWTGKLNDHMDPSKYSPAALKGKLSNILKQQYKEAYSVERDTLAAEVKSLETSKAELEATRKYYSDAIARCKANLNRNIDILNAITKGQYTLASKFDLVARNYSNRMGELYRVDGEPFTLQQLFAAISTDKKSLDDANGSLGTVGFTLQSVEASLKDNTSRLASLNAVWTAFSDNMKTEFNYFYGELVQALKEDEEISKLAKSANTTEAKATLANKIKEKADNIINEKLNAQLLNGCKIEFVQTGLMFDIKVHYNNQGWLSTFSVDDFISTDNHLAIINSEASKKRDEVAKKLAEYMQKQYTKITDGNELNGTIQSVLENLKKNGNLTIKENGKETTVDLGIEIVNITNNQVTFSLASGSEERETVLTFARIANEYNKMVNMQAMEATRQQNEGTIEYTPFGRKLWNSIGSQAQHVLDTLNQISDLSDVKDRAAFENDLKYVAGRILTRGSTPYGLQGDHHTDTSIKAEDLQKIQEFASKIGQ